MSPAKGELKTSPAKAMCGVRDPPRAAPGSHSQVGDKGTGRGQVQSYSSHHCPNPYRSSAPSSLVTLSEDWITITGLARSWETSSCSGEERESCQQGRGPGQGPTAEPSLPPGWRSGSAPG